MAFIDEIKSLSVDLPTFQKQIEDWILKFADSSADRTIISIKEDIKKKAGTGQYTAHANYKLIEGKIELSGKECRIYDEELVEKINSNKDRLKISSLYSPIHMDLDSITFNQYTCQTQISKNKILFTDLDKIQVQFFISEFGKIVFNKMADRIKVDGVIVEPILRVFRQSEFDKAVYIKDKEIYEYKYKSKVPHGLYADIIVKYCFKY